MLLWIKASILKHLPVVCYWIILPAFFKCTLFQTSTFPAFVSFTKGGGRAQCLPRTSEAVLHRLPGLLSCPEVGTIVRWTPAILEQGRCQSPPSPHTPSLGPRVSQLAPAIHTGQLTTNYASKAELLSFNHSYLHLSYSQEFLVYMEEEDLHLKHGSSSRKEMLLYSEVSCIPSSSVTSSGWLNRRLRANRAPSRWVLCWCPSRSGQGCSTRLPGLALRCEPSADTGQRPVRPAPAQLTAEAAKPLPRADSPGWCHRLLVHRWQPQSVSSWKGPPRIIESNALVLAGLPKPVLAQLQVGSTAMFPGGSSQERHRMHRPPGTHRRWPTARQEPTPRAGQGQRDKPRAGGRPAGEHTPASQTLSPYLLQRGQMSRYKHSLHFSKGRPEVRVRHLTESVYTVSVSQPKPQPWGAKTKTWACKATCS